jgi:hypothetical protein
MTFGTILNMTKKCCNWLTQSQFQWLLLFGNNCGLLWCEFVLFLLNCDLGLIFISLQKIPNSSQKPKKPKHFRAPKKAHKLKPSVKVKNCVSDNSNHMNHPCRQLTVNKLWTTFIVCNKFHRSNKLKLLLYTSILKYFRQLSLVKHSHSTEIVLP